MWLQNFISHFALIGAQKLCFETIDHPDEVKRVVNGHFSLFQEVYNDYQQIVTRYQEGSTNWLAVYSEKPWYYISEDFMVMLSAEGYEEFIAGPLRQMAAFHERSIFHLDGENAVRHLDAVLLTRELTGVQVQATPAAQSANFWIPYLKRIQKAGKICWIEARHRGEVRELIENLEPEGLFIKLRADSETETKVTEAMVARYYGKNSMHGE